MWIVIGLRELSEAEREAHARNPHCAMPRFRIHQTPDVTAAWAAFRDCCQDCSLVEVHHDGLLAERFVKPSQ